MRSLEVDRRAQGVPGSPTRGSRFRAVSFIDVAGARALVAVRRLGVQQRQTEHPVRLCGVDPDVRRVLELLGIADYFPVAED